MLRILFSYSELSPKASPSGVGLEKAEIGGTFPTSQHDRSETHELRFPGGVTQSGAEVKPSLHLGFAFIVRFGVLGFRKANSHH